MLFAVSAGKDMTKLEIKTRTGLSMTTVISSVEALVKRGLVTFEEIKGARGGKMHSVINVHSEKRVYGVSYKSGVLTAVAADLKGEIRESVSEETPSEVSPLGIVYALVAALREKAPPPLAIALALNCEGKDEVLKGLGERYHASVISLTNTEAVAYLALYQGASLPVAAIGIGNAIKCAVIERGARRAVDLGTLASPALIAGEGSYASALSVSAVESALRASEYRGKRLVEGGRIAEIRDLADYSHALALTIRSLAETVARLLSPAETIMFGEYLSETFFSRVKKEGAENLCYLRPEKQDFALGAALAALFDEVFS